MAASFHRRGKWPRRKLSNLFAGEGSERNFRKKKSASNKKTKKGWIVNHDAVLFVFLTPLFSLNGVFSEKKDKGQ
jgi:hypothetical protein